MRLGLPDATGRQSPEVIEGANYVEPADLVIKALGFEPEDLPQLWSAEGLEVTRWGTIRADFETGQTRLPGVYAVGDIVRGASLVVWAIRDGRDCAAAILAQFDEAQSIAAE
jgi:glutamate synthase (NADPH/NADH) small chain